MSLKPFANKHGEPENVSASSRPWVAGFGVNFNQTGRGVKHSSLLLDPWLRGYLASKDVPHAPQDGRRRVKERRVACPRHVRREQVYRLRRGGHRISSHCNTCVAGERDAGISHQTPVQMIHDDCVGKYYQEHARLAHLIELAKRENRQRACSCRRLFVDATGRCDGSKPALGRGSMPHSKKIQWVRAEGLLHPTYCTTSSTQWCAGDPGVRPMDNDGEKGGVDNYCTYSEYNAILA